MHLLQDLVVIEETRTVYLPIPIETDKIKIERLLDEVLEFKNGYERDQLLPIHGMDSISESLQYVAIKDYSLEKEPLVNILKVLSNLEELKSIFSNEDERELYPLAFQKFKILDYQSDLYKEFKIIFDDHGEIRPDASPELKSISKAIKSKELEIDQVFRSLLSEYRKNNWLSESGESIRNNRRVVAIASEHKRKIKGIIHDESSTGRTTYIEPEAIIEKNNELFDLEIDFQKEIYRLLKVLSNSCHLHLDMVKNGWDTLLKFDFIRAKALLALRYEGFRPEVKDQSKLKIAAGRHPLLYMKNKPIGKSTVPFDLILLGDNRILILSGPNAGGKSVAMKATILIQLMLQSGMLIPVHEASEMGIFHSFLGDIGDHQSLEDDLSTYSSRLLLMKQFLDVADDRSLICIDEFGSGTDPKLGAAIAESILLALNKKKVHGVITTHYSNLKVLAFKVKGLINGAMVFDTEKLKPTFQLKVGRPGSSYAFEVATRSGLDPMVIEHAKRRTHQDQKELEELLIDLQRDKANLEEQLKKAKDRETAFDKLVKNYESMNADLEFRKKKLKLDQKTWEIQAAKELSDKVEKTLSEIKATPHHHPRAKQHLEKSKQNIESLQQEVKSLDKEIHLHEVKHQIAIIPGTSVRMKNGSEIGKVVSLRNGIAEVSMGSLTLNINARDLVGVKEPIRDSNPKKVKTFLVEEKTVESSLDLRGMSKSQAIELLQNYLDRALLSNVHEVRILHGKGTGILRDLVRAQMKEYKAITKIFHPSTESGGEGVSIIQLA